MIAEVLETLDGVFRLTKRSPTLDGSVPLRVARGCVPLLEGNAYGLQVTLAQPLLVRRRWRGWQASWTDGSTAERLHAGAWPRLAEEGYLAPRGAWVRALRGPLVSSRPRGLRLFTGLLVRPAPGVWLRVSSAANRRNTLFEVAEQIVPDDGRWVPIVLDLDFRRGAPAELRLEGEIACLGALQPGVRISSGPLEAAPELAHAHATFYDRAYFEDKREDVTGKYRQLVGALAAVEAGPPEAECRVASVGASRHSIEALDRFTTASGPRPERRGNPRRLDTIVFRNEIAFDALYDGHTVSLEYDRPTLAARTQPVQAALRGVLAGGAAPPHPGSELYLTKYFTPHIAGEPHFFVKPWALTATPPGWSSLIEGVHGPGYDVLRGVVATDVFHATPAVFRIHREGEAIHVPEDAPLLRVVPVPRRLLAHDFSARRLA